ncbi:hypothetical protein HF394_19985 (plasmid) [Planococcus glaciei]|uniref:Uncharacterized protein n=1 Tax=Planococcus glaciei TaxID=459472 RepID=A0A7H8QGA2_9BACL|nr:hypothetical protein [Planococcus glaciei]QKX52809.1 hypothetical protein HF394_19450 [Planococcus glaciei]QKX52909.1 hypothetical protein HF394_19985 [Planococcus glaciei]
MKMNNTEQTNEGLYSSDPARVYYRHLTSETLSQAAALAEHLFSGTCEAVTQKTLSPLFYR